MKRIIIAALLSALAPAVNADMFQPSHSCTKPYKPYQFTSQWEVDSFNSSVRLYKQCINDFIEEQNDAIRTHQNATTEAVDEWNSFVSVELN